MMHRMKGPAGMLAAVLMVGAGTMAAQAHDWAIDKSHSEADFSVKHMGIIGSEVKIELDIEAVRQ